MLNEVEAEHSTTPEQYTERYDAIVEGIRKVSPQTKFMGLALAKTGGNPKYYEYFLNSKNHKPGIPIDFISFHFYASPAPDEGLDDWQHSFFDQADGFIATTRFILAIRDRLAPTVKIDTNELGVILPSDGEEIRASKALPDKILHRYWNAAAALYAYLFAELSKQGVDVIGESQLVGYPSQFPSVSMINYNTGKPNSRYWVLKLLKDNFHPGDKIVVTKENMFDRHDLKIQGFVTPQGRRILVVNKTNREATVELPTEWQRATSSTVDEDTGDEEPRTSKINGSELKLAPFAVTVLKAE
ncbi:MAG: hypothetical protein DMG63_10670 [Acidobacteria bacterium]|nr:MAG: hypothetical protein DMG63_10670 [Acidobacteriota bacterium]